MGARGCVTSVVRPLEGSIFVGAELTSLYKKGEREIGSGTSRTAGRFVRSTHGCMTDAVRRTATNSLGTHPHYLPPDCINYHFNSSPDDSANSQLELNGPLNATHLKQDFTKSRLSGL